MVKCQFTTKYWNYESQKQVEYNCPEDEVNPNRILPSTPRHRCIFHTERYFSAYDAQEAENRKDEVRKKLMDKIEDSVTNNKALFCIGYHLPDSITIKGDFSKPVYFSEAKLQGIDFSSADFSGGAYFTSTEFSGGTYFGSSKFSGGANFTSAKFSVGADFHSAKFSGSANFGLAEFSVRADFHSAKFSEEADFTSTFKDNAFFNYVLFEDGRKILFGIEDLSKFSFMNTDITRVRFSDRARWGEKDKFKVVEEEMLEKSLLVKSPQQVSLGSVMAVYRNLRENYEFRLRYDEAGEFFIKEMELKRKYKENKKKTSGSGDSSSETKRNGRLRRNLSLTGLYYNLSKYGESIARPTVIGAITVGLSTLFWLIQNNPTAEPSLVTKHSTQMSNFINMTHIWVWNSTHALKAFERSFADFLPLLPLGSDIKIGVIDYIIKIVGGVLTFGLLAIALRRKFERKYTR